MYPWRPGCGRQTNPPYLRKTEVTEDNTVYANAWYLERD
jgi:hypothetical protein